MFVTETWACAICLALVVERGHRWHRRPELVERDLGPRGDHAYVHRLRPAMPWGPANAIWDSPSPNDAVVSAEKDFAHGCAVYLRDTIDGFKHEMALRPPRRGAPRRVLIAFLIPAELSDWCAAYDTSQWTLRRGLARGEDVEDILLRAQARQRRRQELVAITP